MTTARPAATPRPTLEVLDEIAAERTSLGQFERDLAGLSWWHRRIAWVRRRDLRGRTVESRARVDALIDELAGGYRRALANLAEMSRRRLARQHGEYDREWERLLNEVGATRVHNAEPAE